MRLRVQELNMRRGEMCVPLTIPPAPHSIESLNRTCSLGPDDALHLMGAGIKPSSTASTPVTATTKATMAAQQMRLSSSSQRRRASGRPTGRRRKRTRGREAGPKPTMASTSPRCRKGSAEQRGDACRCDLPSKSSPIEALLPVSTFTLKTQSESRVRRGRVLGTDFEVAGPPA